MESFFRLGLLVLGLHAGVHWLHLHVSVWVYARCAPYPEKERKTTHTHTHLSIHRQRPRQPTQTCPSLSVSVHLTHTHPLSLSLSTLGSVLDNMQAVAGVAGGDSAGALGMFLKVQKFLKSIGEDPKSSDGTVGGEETDGAVKKVHPGIMDMVAVGGGEWVILCTANDNLYNNPMQCNAMCLLDCTSVSYADPPFWSLSRHTRNACLDRCFVGGLDIHSSPTNSVHFAFHTT